MAKKPTPATSAEAAYVAAIITTPHLGSFTLDPANPPQLSAEDRARLDGMTDAEITAAAEADPANPPLTPAELAQLREIRARRAAAAAKAAREKTGLSQRAFAEAFRVNLGRLRDAEQARGAPDSAFVAYLQVIAAAPDVVRQAIAAGEG